MRSPVITHASHARITLKKNRMGPMSNQNNLQLVNTKKHPELKLSELGRRTIFWKMRLRAINCWNAMKDQTVNFPIAPTDVIETLTKLPRTPFDAGLSVVQLKR